jgi:tetratricopeptide (TPR) repeat protein/type II secretory pathway pseudopilin PulG
MTTGVGSAVFPEEAPREMAHCRRLCLLALIALVLTGPAARAAEDAVEPAGSAELSCRVEGALVAVTWRADLANATSRKSPTVILPAGALALTRIEAHPGIVFYSHGGAVLADLPPEWEGRVTAAGTLPVARQRGDRAGAVIPLPPALAVTIALEFVDGPVDLDPPDGAVLLPRAGGQAGHSFRMVARGGRSLALAWNPAAPARPARWEAHERHSVTARSADYVDEVALAFDWEDGAPSEVVLEIPTDASLRRVDAPDAASWQLTGHALTVRLREDFPGGSLGAGLILEGPIARQSGGAGTFAVPLLVCPGAARHLGEVRVRAGEADEVSFEEAVQTTGRSADGEGWRLGCTFHSPGARVVLRIAPARRPTRAEVVSAWKVSEFRAEATHRIKVVRTASDTSELLFALPERVLVSDCSADGGVEWSQEGTVLRVRPKAASVDLIVRTERLTEDGGRWAVLPPVPQGVESVDYRLALHTVPGLRLTADPAFEAWRVRPETLPAWVEPRQAAACYAFTDRPQAVGVVVSPVQAEIRGRTLDWVAVREDRVHRESFLQLRIDRAALDRLEVVLPAGVIAERVEGPLVAGWEPKADGGGIVLTLRRPTLGELSFIVVSSAPSGNPLALQGIHPALAPQIGGFLAVGSAPSVEVRPLGGPTARMESRSPEQVPAYLRELGAGLFYEFYDGRWEAELQCRHVEPAFTSRALQAVSVSSAEARGIARFNVDVTQGALSHLEFVLPEAALAATYDGPQAVETRFADGRLRVRLAEPLTGRFSCAVEYSAVPAPETGALAVAPVALSGSGDAGGTLLVLQARSDTDITAGPPAPGLSPTDARTDYAEWSYAPQQPPVAAFTYRGTDWVLPLRAAAQPPSGEVVDALVPLARLDTLMQEGEESLHHLRLFVSNTSRQFLTVDLAAHGLGGRLIGTFADGEPLKPFTSGLSRLQLPLFTTERSAELGITVLDVLYTAPNKRLQAWKREAMACPELDVPVGRLEWLVRVPPELRLAATGGNLEPASAATRAPRTMAGIAGSAVLGFLSAHGRLLLVGGGTLLGAVLLLWLLYALRRAIKKVVFARMPSPITCLVAVLAVAILAAMMMPALSRAREEARVSALSSNLHNIGLGWAMYRKEHEGEPPPDLMAIAQQGYLDDLSLFEWQGRKVQYRPLDKGADEKSVVAYCVVPDADGAQMLFADIVVQWTPFDENGDLYNPRTGALVARAAAGPLAEKAYFADEARTGFGAMKAADVDDIAEAVKLQRQMGEGGLAADSPAAVEQQRALDEALFDAREVELEDAAEMYRGDHGGKEPSGPADYIPYVRTEALREALRRLQQHPPVLARAREEARRSNRTADLHCVGLGLQMHANAHNGEFPARLPDILLKRYVDDPSVFANPTNGVVYRRPERDAPAGTCVAYTWPHPGGVIMLFKDNAVQWVGADDRGMIVNPRLKGDVEFAAAGPPEGDYWTQDRLLAYLRDQFGQHTQEGLAADRYSLGLAYMDNGDYSNAMANFDEALKLDAGNADARAARRRAETLQKGVAGKAAVIADGAELAQLQKQVEERDAESRRLDSLLAELGPAPPAAEPELAAVSEETVAPPRRTGKASLVTRVGGGRTLGALPIEIDFPSPPTAGFVFIKPFLGRAVAEVSFRPVYLAMLHGAELALALIAVLAYILVRIRSQQAAVTLAGTGMCIFLAACFAVPQPFGGVFCLAGVLLGLCLGLEAAGLAAARFSNRSRHGDGPLPHRADT